MDNTDRKLMLLIYEDPRMPFREIAKRLGISRQAVNHRMQVLTKFGVFRSIRATISVDYLDEVPVAVWGRSRAASVDETLERLGEIEFTTRVDVLGGNELFVVGGLRKLSELDRYVEFVKRAAEMSEPTVGIYCFGDGINPDLTDGGKRRQNYRELTPLDLKIIASLQDDARKPIAVIADRVGTSAKTVRRHLDRMKSEGSLDFDEPWDLPPGEDMFTLLRLNLRAGADKVRVARRLLSKDPLHVVYFRSFSNLPNFLIGLISSDKMSEIRRNLREISADEDVLAVIPNLIYLERSYVAWDQKLLALLSRPLVKPRKHHPHARTRSRRPRSKA